MSSRERERRVKVLSNVGLAVLAVAAVGATALALAPSDPPPVSEQVQSYMAQPTGPGATAGAQATATPKPAPTAPIAPLPAEAGKLLWADTFNRADGEPGADESGQKYLTHWTNNQRPMIVDGALESVPQDKASRGSGYIALRLPEPPVHLVQHFTIRGEGTGANSAVSIVPGNGATIPEIIDSDVHAIHTRDGIAIQVRDSASGDYRTVDSWPVSIERNTGQVYEWSITRVAPDTVRLVDATGKAHTSTDPRYVDLWGPDVYIQAVDGSADKPTPGDTTAVTGMWAYAGK